MEKYDYKAALNALEIREDLGRDIEASPSDILGSTHTETIRHALRFAEKMMQEPSRKMIEEAVNLRYDRAIIKTSLGYILVSEFKAMRDAALKELGE